MLILSSDTEKPFGSVRFHFDISGARAVSALTRFGCVLDMNGMRTSTDIEKIIAFIGIINNVGEFQPYGTAFFVGYEEGSAIHLHIVTARHVLDHIEQSRRNDRKIYARLNVRSGDLCICELSNTWFFHSRIKGCDVAVSPIDVDLEQVIDGGYYPIPSGCLTDAAIAANDFGPGDLTATIGLLVTHFGRNRNIPIVRTGNIAAMKGEPVDLGPDVEPQEVYLVECRSIGGLSGSPVFLNTPPFRAVYNNVQRSTAHDYLMGINIGLIETSAYSDIEKNSRDEQRKFTLEQISAGIAIVAPIDRVVEIIRDDPVLIEVRKLAIEAWRKSSGFVPTAQR